MAYSSTEILTSKSVVCYFIYGISGDIEIERTLWHPPEID